MLCFRLMSALVERKFGDLVSLTLPRQHALQPTHASASLVLTAVAAPQAELHSRVSLAIHRLTLKRLLSLRRFV